jgi:type IV secretory pathway protease TraF
MIDHRTMTTTTFGVAVALTATINFKPAPLLIWNASQSVHIGLYRMQSADQLTVTDLVVAMPTEPLASFLALGGYLGSAFP